MCSSDLAPTSVQFMYKPKGSDQLKYFDASGPRPDDVDTTKTTKGVVAPFIVRVETGVINRAIYQQAVLYDPAAPAPVRPAWPPKLDEF